MSCLTNISKHSLIFNTSENIFTFLRLQLIIKHQTRIWHSFLSKLYHQTQCHKCTEDKRKPKRYLLRDRKIKIVLYITLPFSEILVYIVTTHHSTLQYYAVRHAFHTTGFVLIDSNSSTTIVTSWSRSLQEHAKAHSSLHARLKCMLRQDHSSQIIKTKCMITVLKRAWYWVP